MNYEKIYYSIINNRKRHPVTGYVEQHHIIPRSLGGLDTADNLVNLKAKEHFICHLLLTKVYPIGTIEWAKMIKAFGMMLWCSSGNQERITSRGYEKVREIFSKLQSISQSGESNSQFGTKWIHSLDLKQSKKIPKNSEIPGGWLLGRVVDFDKLEKLENQKRNKREKEEQELQIKMQTYSLWYEIYKQFGYVEFCQRTGYNKSQPNLVQQFSKYLKEFEPQNGKRRGFIPQ